MRGKLLIALVLLFGATSAFAAKRVALVVGNGAYSDAPLRNTINDADDMNSALRSLGFSVTLLKNANRESMMRAIDDFGRNLRGSEIGLFYFAGHGAEVRGRNYLFPIKAKVNNEADVRYRTVEAGYVLAEMEAAGPQASIVILDACRNNPFTRGFRSGTRGLAMMDAPTGSLIAFATSPGNIAADGNRRNGLYTEHLLKHLTTPGLSLRDVMLKTRIGVAQATGRKQIPWESTSLMSQIYLAGQTPATQTQVSMAPVPGAKPVTESVSPPSPRQGDTWTEPTTGMEFVWVPGGCFQMGTNNGPSDEKPLHEVCVDGFWMGKYEVTNAQYRRYKADHFNKGRYLGISLNGDRQPVVYVSWSAAKTYADWLSSKGNGSFRLPTEAEWEYAARAGTATKRYWGDGDEEACRYANTADQTAKKKWADWMAFDCTDGYAVSAPVGSFRPNRFGLYDMMGNVWEWCHDRYDKSAYSKHFRNNPVSTDGSSHRVLRGGCWHDGPGAVRSANRSKNEPDYTYYFAGFRLIRNN